MKAILVNLQACLGLVLPSQYYPIIVWENEASFQVSLLCGPHLLLGHNRYTCNTGLLIREIVKVTSLNTFDLLQKIQYAADIYDFKLMLSFYNTAYEN